MKVSLIIPFREKNQVLEECIKSAKSQNYKDIEIITVSDRTKLEDKKIISLFNSELKGVGVKRNFGAKRANGDILFFLDSDCILKKDSIQNLVKIFKNKDTEAVSGKTITPKNANILGTITGLEYEYRFRNIGEDYVDVAATTCLGVKKDIFKKMGGFRDYSQDEAIGEDWDFTTRLVQNNYRIYHTNKVEVFHQHAFESLFHFLKRRYEHARYRITHFEKYKKLSDRYINWKIFIFSTVFLGLPISIEIFEKTKNPKILLLPLVSLLRNIAWFFGFLIGMMFSKKNF